MNEKQISAILQNKKKLKVKKQKEELTQADLQRLKVLVQEETKDVQHFIRNTKVAIQSFWLRSDKGAEDGEWAFDKLNYQKNQLRSLKVKLFNLEQTQKRIKSMLS